MEVALEAIRGRLTDPRLSLVRTVFARLRGGGDAPASAATSGDVVLHFDPEAHPDVIAARRAPQVKAHVPLLVTTDILSNAPGVLRIVKSSTHGEGE